MPQGIWNVEWLNANSQRRFPLTNSSTARDLTGDFEIPNDFLVELTWAVSSGIDTNPLAYHISKITVFSQNVFITFGYNGQDVASINIAAASHSVNKSYQATGASDGPFFDSVIRATIFRLDSILTQPAGLWEFDANGARIEPTRIRPNLRGVSALYLRDGSETSNAIQGDVVLSAGTNFRIVKTEEDDITVLRLDAINGEGFNSDCECTGGRVAPAIKTINGIKPDASGNFQVQGDDCLSVNSITNGLQVEDTCSKPCCGCQELDVVTAALTELANKVATIEDYAQNLDQMTQQLSNIILPSRINYNPNPV
jgi:hypothetical protein